MSTPAPSFAPLSAPVLEEFSKARNFVADLAERLADGRRLTRSEGDLTVLQTLVEHKDVQHANFDAWVALGVAFGDAISASIPGLEWRLVTDPSGTSAALQFRSMQVSIAAPTMLWKRVERGQRMDLAFMTQEIRLLLEEAALDSQGA